MPPATESPLPDGPSKALLDAASAVLAPWAQRTMLARLDPPFDQLELSSDVQARVETVAEVMAADIIAGLSTLMATDVDEQSTSPLAMIRERVRPATQLLIDLGAPRPRRDEFDRRNFPDDLFGIGPTTWADIDPSLHEPGLIWGAWKAMTVMQRHAHSGTDHE